MGCVCAFFLYFMFTLYADVFFCGALKRKNNIYFIYLKPINNVYTYVQLCIFVPIWDVIHLPHISSQCTKRRGC